MVVYQSALNAPKKVIQQCPPTRLPLAVLPSPPLFTAKVNDNWSASKDNSSISHDSVPLGWCACSGRGGPYKSTKCGIRSPNNHKRAHRTPCEHINIPLWASICICLSTGGPSKPRSLRLRHLHDKHGHSASKDWEPTRTKKMWSALPTKRPSWLAGEKTRKSKHIPCSCLRAGSPFTQTSCPRALCLLRYVQLLHVFIVYQPAGFKTQESPPPPPIS